MKNNKLEKITNLFEETEIRELTKEYKPMDLNENKEIAKMAGNVSKLARDDI